jgi:DNA-binding transcriptional LysR family regulator
MIDSGHDLSPGHVSTSGPVGADLSGLDLRRLQYFVAVAEERSFTRAAERLYVTQPSLSVAIRKLEQELGLTLFDRSSRHVVLTAAAEALLPKARRAISAADDVYTTASNVAKGIAGVLRVGVSPASHSAAMPILSELARGHPQIEVEVRQEATGLLVTDLCAHRIDILVGASVQAPVTLGRQLVRLDEALLAVHPDNAHASRDVVALEELRDETFVIGRDALTPGYNQAVIAFCLEAGFAPNTMVSPGLLAPPGVSPERWVIMMNRSGIEVMQLDFEPVWVRLDPPRYFRIELIWRLGTDEELIGSFRSAASSVTRREHWGTGPPSS